MTVSICMSLGVIECSELTVCSGGAVQVAADMKGVETGIRHLFDTCAAAAPSKAREMADNSKRLGGERSKLPAHLALPGQRQTHSSPACREGHLLFSNPLAANSAQGVSA